jgi:Holliday junction resolvase
MMAEMDPEQYEHHVAAVLEAEGWSTSVTRRSRDLGVDVVATQPGRRLAVQAKMYGATSTKINAEQVMALYGAAAYADCSERMIATNGQLTAEAVLVAAKLDVEVRLFPAQSLPSATPDGFGALWRTHIEPLAGTQLTRSNGKVMQILEVDGAGVLRLTTGGTRQRIAITTFRWTLDRLLAGETVSRQDIHERDPRQVSSGVMLILATIPGIEIVSNGRNKALRMTSPAGTPA